MTRWIFLGEFENKTRKQKTKKFRVAKHWISLGDDVRISKCIGAENVDASPIQKIIGRVITTDSGYSYEALLGKVEF